MTNDLRKEFWDRMDDVRSGMLGATGARSVPMSHFVDDDTPGTLWFITAKGTDIAKSAASGAEAEYIVSSKDEHLYARIHGRITVSQDVAQLDDIWNAFAAAWFEGDQNDPDIQLVRMDLSEAEVWMTDGNLKFLFDVARANVTGKKPDMGQHGTLTF
ncbi:general stress protein [Sulfitobacter sp. EhC04]|uniref:pyridoxamine 5'-phosphate oxidase family protein n=1 Tax=Sulfitobacter sp. EhC04 TaxID=1849168 RepID=UPI0007F4C9C5|nr:pyridoxamine 5'-phosphate oxidase family protein [Sulfitobacter sp. EhC04]OAN79350.1 general stress protein [Sulfitobacter sp. EhC04]